VQALAFDFDGLILDTETPELTVWEEVFREHGAEMPADYWTQVIGRGAEQTIERPPELLTRLTGSFVETPEKHQNRRERILALIDHEKVRPGVESLIQEAKHAGLPIGVASSSRHLWVDAYLRKLNLYDQFEAVVCADDVPHSKPFPDLYLELCRRLKSNPLESAALEDSPNGLTAAKAAGMFAIAVPNRVTLRLNLSEADLRIDRLEDWNLARLIGRFAQRNRPD
jgi:HAD superfamily hydrolase (TIGR01509 family)